MDFTDVLSIVDAGAGVLGIVLFYKAHIQALSTIERLSDCDDKADSDKMST